MKKLQVREKRKKLNLTQKQFAELLGVSVSAVRHWEQGIRNPSTPTLKLIDRLS